MKTVFTALNAKYSHTNLAIRLLRQKTMESGLDTKIREFTINDNISNIIKELYLEKADIYGFSVYIWNTEMTCKVAKEIKKLLPKSIVFFGGPESSYNSKFYLDNSYCDYVLKGEGENTIIPFLTAVENNKEDIKSLVGVEGENFDNGFAPCVDFSDIPYPYYDGEIKELSGRLIYFETSRGCPYRCAYCLSGLDKKIKALSKEDALDKLIKLGNDGAGIVKLVDRTFNFDKKRARYIWQGLIDSNVKASYHFEICASLLEEEDFKILEKAPKNLFMFEIGIQSTNKEVLARVNRYDNLEILLRNIKRLSDTTNIHLHIDLIAGLPGENYISFKKSFNDVYDLAEVLQMGFLKVLYGSMIKENADNTGYIYQSFPPYEVLSTPCLSYDEIIKLKKVEEVLERYSNSGYYKYSIKFILDIFKDYFAFFEKFSCYLEKNNALFEKVSKKREFSLLLDYSEEILNKDMFSLFKEILRFDYTRNFQGQHQIFDYKYPDNYKECIYDFLNNKENIQKYLPWAENDKTKNIAKFIDIHMFNFDENRVFIFDRKNDKIIEITEDFRVIDRNEDKQ